MKDALCPVCHRAGRGIVLQVPDKPIADLCSLDCAQVWISTRPSSHQEADAIARGGQAAGDYLDSIGKTDLAALTPDEWTTFCTKLYVAACEELRRQAGEWVPF